MCSMHPAETRPRPARSLQLGYEFEYTPQDRPRLESGAAYAGQVPGHHDEKYTVSRVHRFKASGELTSRWGADLMLPYIVRSHGHVHHHRGADISDAWNVGGVGDVEAQGRYRFLRSEAPSRPAFTLLAGVKLPTGRENETNAAGDEADVPVQPGSGSWDIFTGISSLQNFTAPSLTGPRDLPLFFSGVYRFNGTGKQRYRRGDVLQVNAGAIYPLFSRVGASLQLNLRVNREDDKGATREETEKTGGTALYATPGLEVRAGDALRVYAHVQFPLYQRVQSLQITCPYSVISGVSWRAF